MPNVTRAGRAALRDARVESEALRAGSLPGDRALAVALFGIGALWLAEPALASELGFARANAVASGSDNITWVDTSSSCGALVVLWRLVLRRELVVWRLVVRWRRLRWVSRRAAAAGVGLGWRPALAGVAADAISPSSKWWPKAFQALRNRCRGRWSSARAAACRSSSTA